MTKILLFSFLLLSLPFIIRPSFAEDCVKTDIAAIPKAEGLISGITIKGLDNPGGNCITGTESHVELGEAQILNPYSTQDYTGFKTTFYDKSKFSVVNHKKPFMVSSIPPDSGDFLYWYKNLDPNLYVTSSPSGSGTKIIFVDGNLNIHNNINYPDPGKVGGLVFVVGGDINIYPSVANVDAVLISFRDICSAGDDDSNCTTSNLPLTINGSLISLGDAGLIKLVRSLTPNDKPAEIINAQPKYLKLLTVNDLMDEDLIIPNESQ